MVSNQIKRLSMCVGLAKAAVRRGGFACTFLWFFLLCKQKKEHLNSCALACPDDKPVPTYSDSGHGLIFLSVRPGVLPCIDKCQILKENINTVKKTKQDRENTYVRTMFASIAL